MYKMKEKMERKIPGMLYILVSFIPWIVYWTLCGTGNKLGVVIPLVISLKQECYLCNRCKYTCPVNAIEYDRKI